jgi:hypothetical protein
MRAESLKLTIMPCLLHWLCFFVLFCFTTEHVPNSNPLCCPLSVSLRSSKDLTRFLGSSRYSPLAQRSCYLAV